ncbi:hypothetical protein [Pelagirhabdus alkalitolerans]|uniref:hypothetical protein n=1 Tax=Pelagirhabdus alkalitolerans TaxID=1612202 RepID=UPI001C40AB63|nr:hypothetical protein [Pelagirhabdus alkalitolerans]
MIMYLGIILSGWLFAQVAFGEFAVRHLYLAMKVFLIGAFSFLIVNRSFIK